MVVCVYVCHGGYGVSLVSVVCACMCARQCVYHGGYGETESRVCGWWWGSYGLKATYLEVETNAGSR